MAYPKTILIGDRVRYESAAGTIRGEVVKIMQDRNAAGNMIDWIYIEYYNHKSPTKKSIVRLADGALEMIKFVVTFRDVELQKVCSIMIWKTSKTIIKNLVTDSYDVEWLELLTGNDEEILLALKNVEAELWQEGYIMLDTSSFKPKDINNIRQAAVKQLIIATEEDA